MLIERTKGRKKRWLPAREIILFAAGLLVLALISMPLAKNYNRRKSIDKQIAAIEEEIKKTENKNTDLQKLIDYFRSDQFVEEQARLNLNMKKPGESVAIVSPDDSIAASRQTSGSGTGPAEPAAANPHRWLKYFFK